MFIVDRLAWYPDSPNESSVTNSHVELAKHDVDIGLLDYVRESNTRSLGSRDAEAFYQMIAGVNKSSGPTPAPQLAFTDAVEPGSRRQKVVAAIG